MGSLPKEVAEACEAVRQRLCLSHEDLLKPQLLSVHALLHIAVRHSSSWEPKRCLNLLLLFGGKAGAAKKMNEMNMGAKSLDKINDASEDILCITGCLQTTYWVMSVVRHGTVWASPECRTWLSFISRKTYGRTSDSTGIWGSENVTAKSALTAQSANDVAVLLSHMLFLCSLRQVFYAVEQPLNSLLFKNPCIASMLLGDCASRVVCCAGALGASTIKPLEIFVTWPELYAIQNLKFNRKDARKHFKGKCQKPKQLAHVQGRWTRGAHKCMKSSAEYPWGLCEAIANGAVQVWTAMSDMAVD